MRLSKKVAELQEQIDQLNTRVDQLACKHNGAVFYRSASYVPDYWKIVCDLCNAELGWCDTKTKTERQIAVLEKELADKKKLLDKQ